MTYQDRYALAVNVAAIVLALAAVFGVMWGVKTIQVKRYQQAQMKYIERAHQSHVDRQTLCEAIWAQEDIILHELPIKVFMSWTAATREICK